MISDNELILQKEFIFRHDGYHYFCTNYLTALTPADLVNVFGFEVPDYVQFVRYIDYERGLQLTYRVNGGIIHITILTFD